MIEYSIHTNYLIIRIQSEIQLDFSLKLIFEMNNKKK